MPDLIYYCTKENNDCQKRIECERYLDSDSHTNKTTLCSKVHVQIQTIEFFS